MLLAAVLLTALLFTTCQVDGTVVPKPEATPTETSPGWSEAAPMPTARSEITSAVLDGKIYVVGGFTSDGRNSAVVEAYDPAADTWQPAAPLPVTLDHAMAAAVNGKLYVMGGYRVFGGEISSPTYEYDPTSDTWTERAPLPSPRAAGAAVTTHGLIYVVGGVGPEPARSFVYNPESDGWSEFDAISAPREHLTAVLDNRTIYVIGGRWQGVNVSSLEALTIAPGETWEVLEPMPTARGGLASAVLDGTIHVVGGEDLRDNSTFAQHEVFDPATGGWTAAPPLPTARHGLTAQTVGGRLYVIGGGPQARLSVSSLVEVYGPGE